MKSHWWRSCFMSALAGQATKAQTAKLAVDHAEAIANEAEERFPEEVFDDPNLDGAEDA